MPAIRTGSFFIDDTLEIEDQHLLTSRLEAERRVLEACISIDRSLNMRLLYDSFVRRSCTDRVPELITEVVGRER